jgi:hypothetical protein
MTAPASSPSLSAYSITTARIAWSAVIRAVAGFMP